jgi:hypothetical protein
MEAMVGAAAAALTIYDMVKGVERGVEILSVRLAETRGGRTGEWRRGAAAGDAGINPPEGRLGRRRGGAGNPSATKAASRAVAVAAAGKARRGDRR